MYTYILLYRNERFFNLKQKKVLGLRFKLDYKLMNTHKLYFYV